MMRLPIVSFVTFLLASLLFGVAIGLLIKPMPYEQCQEDEVWDWSHNGGDYPDDIEWGCVPFDDLMEMYP